MIKKTVKYMAFDDTERVEDFYFHLSAAELVEMQLDSTTVVGAMIRRLRERVEQAEAEGIAVEDLEDFTENDVPKLWQVIKTFVLYGYGQRLDNGGFKKSTELREQFAATEAYSVLILELCSDAEKGAAFINGMVPANLSEQVAKLDGREPPKEPRPLAVVPEARKVTRSELVAMPLEEMPKLNAELAEGRAVIVDDPVAS